jgi:UDP-N-acetyl-D-mannosaminuronic acid transferase (WecB/TagA/CpsF family)
MSGGASRKRERVLGIDFFTGAPAAAVAAALNEGALVLAPSGPGLAVDLVNSPAYRGAVMGAEVNLTDSGLMVLLWRLRSGRRLPRLSGLGFLRSLLATPEVKALGATFWVMPGEEDLAVNLRWLNASGIPVTKEDCYVAPRYGPGEIEDMELVSRVRTRRPRVVIVTIGGGVQERLGWSLRRTLDRDENRPGMVCIGAAIGFLTGTQVAIPGWVDRWMLGWLWRIMSSPKQYAPRYWAALRLIGLVLRYGEKAPPFKP